ncbi:MAG: DUF3618 domain-containing protein [Candidatus Eremiobacteraeota bacterium]|nr:DUF3618 domain-containing protein [Candidatus Eremiobacteraeota bacterium]
MEHDLADIRRQIERTRERLGETARALRYKTDVRARSREAVAAKVSGVVDGVTKGFRDVLARARSRRRAP